ncbi:MAG TPA: outer membrane beta-barrel protein [Polyangiaceae bacterium]|nr:outer membrane beta-barrel protein [Polyangiaceae bacterium]
MSNRPSESERKPGKAGFLLALAGCSAVATIVASPPAAAQTAGAPTAAPPPTSVEYVQYGVSLHTLTLLGSGAVCPDGARTPCIVGSGGGLGLRMGYRSRGPFYLGAAFQLSRLNSSNLLRLAILQRLTAEGRYYFDRGNRLTPYLLGGVGGAIYGNEWGASAGGATFSFGVGLEYQISERTMVTLLPTYQPMLFRRFEDSTGQVRAAGPLGFGLAHWLAVQIVIEVRDPLSRW